MSRFRTALLALAALALVPAAAEAGHKPATYTITNDAGVVARVKWRVGDSVSGWTNLTIGQSTSRTYPADYPQVEITVEYQALFDWVGACKGEFWPKFHHDVNFRLTGVIPAVKCAVGN